jgi:hypothetical protein
MANTQSFGYTAKQAALAALVNGTSLKGALYLASATTDGSVPAYTPTGEVVGTNYTPGGVSVPNANTAGLTANTTYWTPSGSIVYTGVTLSTPFDAIMIYDTGAANRNMAVYTFGSQTIVAGTLTLAMPANTSVAALVRLA